MELTFEKEGNKWVAEFEVASEFNLHIEKGVGALNVLQTTVAGMKPDYVPSLHLAENDAVLDKTVPYVPFPISLRIEARTKEAPIAIVTVGEGGSVGYSEAQIRKTLNTPV